MNINMDKVILFLDKDDMISESNEFLSNLVDMGIYNFTKDEKNLMYLYNNPNTYRDVAYLQNLEDNESVNIKQNISHFDITKKILGIKNLTTSAGATTLTYMLKKVLSSYYSVMAIEINKRDFIYFNDKDMINTTKEQIDSTLSKYNNMDIFIIDLNNTSKDYVCTDVIYLVEPSIIKLNKLALINNGKFEELKNKKIVLNQSLLTKDEIAEFEVETGLKVFCEIPPLNDKKDNSSSLLPLLEKLGYVKETSDEEKSNKSKSIFNLFK